MEIVLNADYLETIHTYPKIGQFLAWYFGDLSIFSFLIYALNLISEYLIRNDLKTLILKQKYNHRLELDDDLNFLNLRDKKING